ncbi:MAG: YbaB/EbfC family nucleoid-associated protein [Patescibacteria group bacterium]|nr:YbaB/EbfC family nucleoid-associated protein [Patescibacteria group bacterium]
MLDKAKKMWQMQAKAKAIQRELKDMRFEGVELGGRIKVVVNGEQKVESIEIDEELFTPSEKDSVERFLKQAMASAVSKSQQAAANKMKAVAKDLGLGI